MSIRGSDTMVILSQRWAAAYMESHVGQTIEVSGGGSGTGIAALINGTIDVATASRPIHDRERNNLRRQRGLEAVETRVAMDAVSVYVHRDNSISSLGIPTLARLFRGEVQNWSQIGGTDRPIVLYSRQNNSGTYAFFKEHVLGGRDFAASAQTLPGTAAVINAVSRDANGIGYGGIGYAQGVRIVPIAAAGGGAALEPSREAAVSGRYPLARYLYLYTAGQPQGAAERFIAWVRSEAGQALVEEAGYYPLPAGEGAR